MAEVLSELDQIFQHIEQKEKFLLSGGAGSGKTYSLVQVLNRIFASNPSASVACITYTNVAVNEICERVKFENLRVSTIHDFLWNCIKNFQKNLKTCLFELISEGLIKDSSGEITDESFFNSLPIDYKEWRKLVEGIVSHDEILLIAERMFSKYSTLCDILKDKFEFILIDEYQDTSPLVIKILLEHLTVTERKNIIGFFGDSMQSIYPDTVGNINSYITSGAVKEVIKADNRRNPSIIIDLANKLRTDSVIQRAAADNTAPNYGVTGDIKFLYSDVADINKLKTTSFLNTWEFNDASKTKELYLTHNLIAPRAGFPTLMAIYDKDPVLALKGDIIKRISDKGLTIDENRTFDSIAIELALANRQREFKRDILLRDNADLYNKLKDLPFSEVKQIYVDKDQLIGSKKGTSEEERRKGTKRDALIRHLFHIQECIHLYTNRKYNEFLKFTEFQINSIQDKVDLKEAISILQSMKDKPIGDVIEFAHNKGICIKDDKLNDFIAEKSYIFDQVIKIPYQEFYNLYEYVEGYTPFSTQHNIKGAEFDNVLVVLDNGGWSHYNFTKLFSNDTGSSVFERTSKLFYVCCTRAKQNLVVYFENPDAAVIAQATTWFGSANVIKV